MHLQKCLTFGVHIILNTANFFSAGESVVKRHLADDFGVSEKTSQCDLDEIRTYFYDNNNMQGHRPIQ